MTKVIVLCLTVTAAVTAKASGTGVRVIGFTPVRLSFEAANHNAFLRARSADGRVVSLR
jgi:hypothetical protein